MEVEFTPQEKLIGHIVTASGSLLLADGAVQTALKLSQLDIVSIDVDKEQTKIPVYAVNQNGKRFLIIAIDDALPTSYNTDEKVVVEDMVTIPEEPPAEEDVDE